MDFIGAKITTNRLGEVRNNKFGTPMKIVEYRCADDIDVEFLDEHHYIKEHNKNNFDYYTADSYSKEKIYLRKQQMFCIENTIITYIIKKSKKHFIIN